MSYRFVKIFTRYPNYLKMFYRKNPGLADRSYRHQFDCIMADAVGWADHYAIQLKKMGLDAHDLLVNAPALQKAWAREHSVNKDGMSLIIEQLRHLKPDVVYVQDCFSHNGAFIKEVKSAVPSVRKVLAWCCAPYSSRDLENFKVFDVLISCLPTHVSAFQGQGIPAYLMHHAFEPGLLPKIKDPNPYPPKDVFFAGSLIDAEGFHQKRRAILGELLQKNINLMICGEISSESRLMRMLKRSIAGVSALLDGTGLGPIKRHLPLLQKAENWDFSYQRDGLDKQLTGHLSPPLFGLDMLRAIHKAKIGLNIHGDIAGPYAANVRMFEATGAGACLLTDHKMNMRKLFIPDKECVTFSSVAECIEKIEWLLANPEQRKLIASQGQKRTLEKHTFKNRALQLHEIIKNELKK